MNVNRGVGASFFKVALIAVVMSLFAVSCGGGEDEVQGESRVKNAAPQADSGEDGPYLRYCLDLSYSGDLSKPDPAFLLEVLERLYSDDSLGRNGLDYSEVDDLMSAISDNSDLRDLRDLRGLLNLLNNTPSDLRDLIDLLEGLERITSISLDRLRGLLDLDDLSDSKSLIKTIEKFDFLDSSDNRNISDLRKFYDDINLKDVSDIQELIEAVKSDNENNTVLDLMMGLNNYYEADKDFEMVMTNISLIAHSDLFNIRDRLQVCDDASESGTGADDAVSDDPTESASVCSVPAVEQFREDLALFRVAQSGRNDQELTPEQRQVHRDNYRSAYDVMTKSAAAAIEVANARGYSFDVDSPDQLDESFLRNWDSRFCD